LFYLENIDPLKMAMISSKFAKTAGDRLDDCSIGALVSFSLGVGSVRHAGPSLWKRPMLRPLDSGYSNVYGERSVKLYCCNF